MEERKKSKESEEQDASETSEASDENEAISVEGNEEEEEIKKAEIILMPIKFRIKKFFELPNVYEKIQLNATKILQTTKLDHFIKGRLWKKKMMNYTADQIVIPFHFYGDGVQINNALGPHVKRGEQQFCYYTFPTIPREYQSRLDNIFVAQTYPAKLHQEFSSEGLYNNIIDTFQTLAEDGVILNINGTEVKVFFVCGLFIGDNKELNQRLGFVGSFVGLHCCRFCKMHLDDIRTKTNSVEAIRRNIENYENDLVIDNVTATGIKEYSVFNNIPFFHVTESASADIAHDLTEGVLHTILSCSILYFISKGYLTLKELNDRMSNLNYGEAEKGNLPTVIRKLDLEKEKLKMTSSEMFFFAHHFTLMIGDLVPDNDDGWQLVLQTIRFFDLCYLPSYDQQDIDALRTTSDRVNEGFKNLFNLNFQHKAHIHTHYHELVLDYGPLKNIQTIRCEGKHKEMKNYTKNTNSRVHISYSVAKKTQYKFALRLLERKGLEDIISITADTRDSIENKVYFPRIVQSTLSVEMLQEECFFTEKVIINGIIFSKELWLPNMVDSTNMKIYEIIDIMLLDLNDINKMFAVCCTYNRVTYDAHYECYRVDMESLQNELSIININEFISKQFYPVKIHNIRNNHLFRCKRC